MVLLKETFDDQVIIVCKMDLLTGHNNPVSFENWIILRTVYLCKVSVAMS